LVWFVFSPVICVILYNFEGYFSTYLFLSYLITVYSITGIVFFSLGKYLNKKFGLQGYTKNEITIEEIKKKQENKPWSLEINSVEHANKVINETSWTFIILGTIMFVLSLFIVQMQTAWIDGLISIFFGSMLAIKRNTWTSVAVSIIGATTLVATVSNKISGQGGGTNIYLALLILWMSIHSFMAVKYLKNNSEAPTYIQKYRKFFVISAWVSAVLFIFLMFGIIMYMVYK
jgi:hypothetical protein